MELHIGKEIEKRFDESGMRPSEFAKRINTGPRNIYTIFKRKDEQQMINAWGAPTQIHPNGDGKIVVYDKTTYNIYKQPLRKKSFQFFINKNGIIERYLISYK